jgi:hypothetical protein
MIRESATATTAVAGVYRRKKVFVQHKAAFPMNNHLFGFHVIHIL